ADAAFESFCFSQPAPAARIANVVSSRVFIKGLLLVVVDAAHLQTPNLERAETGTRFATRANESAAEVDRTTTEESNG
ncbi:MAG: hypothetical protein ACRENE_05890, partial [Polyangiaceae bacterium]